MRRGLERRLRNIEVRQSGVGRAMMLLEMFEAKLAALSDEEQVERIMALQTDPSAYKKFEGANQFFDDAIMSTLTDAELDWLIATIAERIRAAELGAQETGEDNSDCPPAETRRNIGEAVAGRDHRR